MRDPILTTDAELLAAVVAKRPGGVHRDLRTQHPGKRSKLAPPDGLPVEDVARGDGLCENRPSS
jgi:hypothetical protein